MSSELEQAMMTIVQIFLKYSRHKSTLKKVDLKDLINNEMRQFIMKIQDKDTLDMLFSNLDQNGDREIDFQEFIPFIAMVTSACHDLFMTEHNQGRNKTFNWHDEKACSIDVDSKLQPATKGIDFLPYRSQRQKQIMSDYEFMHAEQGG